MKSYLCQVSALFICLFAFSATARTEIVPCAYYVNSNNGDDSNDGLSWSSAFKNLQTAIDVVMQGDTVKVAAGTYLPTKKMAEVYDEEATIVLPTNDRHRSFLIKKEINLYGGYPADATDATTISDRDWLQHETILCGDLNGDDGDGFENTEENALHVVVMLNLTSETRLDGFFITGGNASGDLADVKVDSNGVFRNCGGGICAISYYTSAPVLANLMVRDNQAKSYGGGFYNFSDKGHASPVLTNVTMIHNFSNTMGGAIHIDGMNAAPVLRNVNLTGNLATNYGGAFFCIAQRIAGPVLENTLISGNKSTTGAGAFIIALSEYAQPEFNNVTVCGNKASSSAHYPEGGGGVFISAQTRDATPHIINSVFWGNRCDDRISNLFIEGANAVVPEYLNNLVEGMDLGGTNLSGDIDPMFINPMDAASAPTITGFGDYRLLPGSPLIDKGNNAFMTLADDLDSNPRICNDIVDIGAYEFHDDNSGNEIMSQHKIMWGHQGDLYVKISRNATVRIFSINGTLVRQLDNLAEGLHVITSLPGDVYIVTLSSGETAKIVIR